MKTRARKADLLVLTCQAADECRAHPIWRGLCARHAREAIASARVYSHPVVGRAR